MTLVSLAVLFAWVTEVQGPLQRLAPIISHMKQLDLQEMLEETPSEQAEMADGRTLPEIWCFD